MANTVLTFSQGGQEAQVTYQFFGVLDVEDFLDFMEVDFWGPLRPITSQGTTLDSISHGQSGQTTERIVDVNGTLFGSTSPISNCMLVPKNVATGRRGRSFWPGISELEVDGAGRLDSGFLTTAQAAWDAAFTAIDASPYGLFVERVGPPPTQDPVTGFSVGNVIGTQRGRLR